jgi:flagellar hook-associated protein 3 FlgL
LTVAVRISTQGFMQGQVESLSRLQAEVQRTQSQVAAGTRLLSPADDPVAASRVQEHDRWMLAAGQHERNGALLDAKLSAQENAIADASDVLQRVRELAVQGGNGALDRSARQMLAAEVRQRAEQMLQIANRQSPSGEHLFAGADSGAAPFVRQGGSVQYAGNDLSRLVEIATGQRVADSIPGSDLFMSVPAGNGTFAVRAGVANAGTGIADGGSLVEPTAWDGAPYRVLIMANGDWEARDAADSLVASGAFASGGAIEFKGIRLSITGTPVAGDQFHLDPAGSEHVFATLDRLAAALEAPLATGAQRASAANELNAVLAQLSQGLDHLSGARAVIGSRLLAVEDAAASRALLREDVAASLSDLRDLDYAEALTRLNMQLTGLQAAQQSMARAGRMSLFDYL